MNRHNNKKKSLSKKLILLNIILLFVIAFIYSKLVPDYKKNNISSQNIPNTKLLKGFTFEWQTMNNCGPASLAMLFSYWDSNNDINQKELAEHLKKNSPNAPVSIYRLKDVAELYGYKVEIRTDNNPEILELFIANGIPLLIAGWVIDNAGNEFGHISLIAGYNRNTRKLIFMDPLYGPKIEIDYERFNASWNVFINVVVVIVPDDKTHIVENIFGKDYSFNNSINSSLLKIKEKLKFAAENPGYKHPYSSFYSNSKHYNAFAWNAIGVCYVIKKDYKDAVIAFEKARENNLPLRLWHYNSFLFEAYYYTQNYSELLKIINNGLSKYHPTENFFYWKGMAEKSLGLLTDAIYSFRKALYYRPEWELPETELKLLE